MKARRLAGFFACVAALVAATPALAQSAAPWQHDTLGQQGRITLTPGFSPDGMTAWFAQTDCTPIGDCPQQLSVSRLQNGVWSAPERVALPGGGRVDYPSVAPDGRSVLFSWTGPHPMHGGRNVAEDFNLWRLGLEAGAEPEAIAGEDINRIREGRVARLRFVNNETAPVLTADGRLFFWTERLDGPGERDIYAAAPDGQNGFEAPEPLALSTPGREDGAWVSPDGRLLLFTSPDRGGCGGSDIFASQWRDGAWSEPRNLGCEINSASDEGAATIRPGTGELVFMSTRRAPGVDTWSLWSAPLPGWLR